MLAQLLAACATLHCLTSGSLARWPAGGGPERLFLFLVTRSGAQQDPRALREQCQAAISRKLNPLFKVERVLLRPSLPRTATNKVMRRVLRDERMPRAKL
jgi:acetyl-CoA synthetase